MANVGNWVVESASTIGTGDILLTGAQIGFTSFVSAVPAGEVWYVIEDSNQKEAGIGVFNGANTITRNNVMATLVNGQYNDVTPTPINLSGLALVACTFNSQAYRDLFNHTINQSNPHIVQASQITYDPTGDPTSSATNVQDAMADHSDSIEQRVASMSGVITGGVLTGAGSTFSVSAGNGAVFDSYTNPANTSIVEVPWLAINNTVLDLGGTTFGSTKIFLTSAGNVLQITGNTSLSNLGSTYSLGLFTS